MLLRLMIHMLLQYIFHKKNAEKNCAVINFWKSIFKELIQNMHVVHMRLNLRPLEIALIVILK